MRIFNDGAEFNDLLFWTTPGADTTVSAAARSGSYAYRIKYTTPAYKSTPDLTEFYFRLGWSYDRILNNFFPLTIAWLHGGTTLGGLLVNNSPACNFVLQIGGVDVATGTTTLNVATYYLTEIYVKIADAGEVILKVDGIQQFDYVGDTKPGADTHIDNLRFLPPYSISYLTIDDLALNDTDNSDGKNDTSWCMDGHYEAHFANDNGDTSGWTGNDGDKVNNFQLVDEVPHDGDTTYVKSNTAGEQDMYKVTDYTPTNKIITRVFAECRAKDASAASGEMKLGIKTDGTVYLSDADRVLTSDYAKVVGDDEKVNPFDSGQWEDADIDAIQFVAECE